MELSRVLGSNLGSLMKKPDVSSLIEMVAGKDSGGQADRKIISNHLSEGAVRQPDLRS